MSLDLLAHLLLGLAFVLALGFHRHRAAQLLLVLWLMLAGIGGAEARWEQGALRFGPWLLLFSVLLPEPRLLSRRHALYLALLGLAVLITLAAPAHALASLLAVASVPGLGMDAAAAALTAFGAGLCGLRGLWRRLPIELGLAGMLALAAAGFAQPGTLAGWLIAAAVVAMGAIGHAGWRMAFLDPLTGLPNRRALDETLARLSGAFALAMVDVDHFKSFNDTHGHEAGDIVLRRVARALAAQAGGRAFRYGGEEFCVVYPGRDAKAAAEALEAARAAIESMRIELPPKPGRGRKGKRVQVSVTVSGGSAARTPERRGAAEVLKTADQALYRAKAKGRNRVLAG